MYNHPRRGRAGIATSLPNVGPAPGPDVPERSITDRILELGLTAATVTPAVKEDVRQLVDEAFIHPQVKETHFQIVAYACALEKEKDVRLLKLVLDLAFKKMKESSDLNYSGVKLFEIMKLNFLPTLQDGVTLDSRGQTIAGVTLLCKYLTDYCYHSIQETWQAKESAAEALAADPSSPTVIASTEVANQQWANVARFVFTSWEQYLVEEPVVHVLIEKQISTARPIEKDIDRLCHNYLKPGRTSRPFVLKDQLEKHYSRISEVANKECLNKYSRRDLEELLVKLDLPPAPYAGALVAQKQNVETSSESAILPTHPLAIEPTASVTEQVPTKTTPSNTPVSVENPTSPKRPAKVTFDPGLLNGGEFQVTPTTPLTMVVAFFTQFVETPIQDYTSELQSAHYSNGPVATSALSDVWRVTLRKGTHVAVKCVRGAVSGNEKVTKHTVMELNFWSKLRHANIMQLLGIALFKDQLAMVSEWMDQGSIISLVRKRPEVDRFALCIQVVGVVAWLHRKDLVHGDLKGANILISQNGIPKLTDFGLSIMQESKIKFSITSQGGGTMRWMAPELLTGSAPRSRETDVYALGMTILEIITGNEPFEDILNGAEIPIAVGMKKRKPTRPECLAAKSSRNDMFWDAMRQCWAYEPSRRATAEDIEKLINSAIEDPGPAKRNSVCCTMA